MIKMSDRGRKEFICPYCGSHSHIEIVSGRDACSYCGAGIKDVAIDESSDSSREIEDLACAIEETTVASVCTTEQVFEEIKPNIRKRAYARAKRQNRGRHGNSDLLKMVGFGLCIIIFFQGFMPVMKTVMFDYPVVNTTDTDVDTDVFISVQLQVVLLNSTTGNIVEIKYSSFLELHKTDGQIMNVFMFKNSMSTQLNLESGVRYELWLYPYANQTVYKDNFVAINSQVYLFSFPI